MKSTPRGGNPDKTVENWDGKIYPLHLISKTLGKAPVSRAKYAPKTSTLHFPKPLCAY